MEGNNCKEDEKGGTTPWKITSSIQKESYWLQTGIYGYTKGLCFGGTMLVAEGFTKTYAIDYRETFALVAKMNYTPTLLACAVKLGWSLQQLDVTNAFLHGNLEEVYMEVPPRVASQSIERKVRKMRYMV